MKRDDGGLRPPPVMVRPLAPSKLHSWKEIAAYLGRDERTVRRWEKAEGLPVHRLQHGKSGNIFADTPELNAWLASRTDSRHKRSGLQARTSGPNRILFAAAILLCFLGGSGLYLSRRAERPSGQSAVTTFTSDPGMELQARLSPDGSYVAFVSDVLPGKRFDLYVRSVSSGPSVRLTNDDGDDYAPAWSPDGFSIAFLRRIAATRAAVLIIPASGGVERQLAEIGAGLWPDWSRPGGYLAWTRDGKYLIAAGRQGSDAFDRLMRIRIDDGSIEPLTSPPRGSGGDTGPAISPDGKWLAFSRRVSWGASDLFVAGLTESATLAGAIRRLETGYSWNASPEWLPEGAALVFSGGRMDRPHLARVAVNGSETARMLVGVGSNGWNPSLARGPDGRLRLVYTEHFESVNIWRRPLDGDASPAQLIVSASWSYEPAYSPDGKHIAFLSDRSGYPEVWVADADGEASEQWTFLQKAGLGAPRWLSDSARIAFTMPGPDGSSIHVLDGPRKAPRELPGTTRCGYFVCSPDGRFIYFTSNRGGSTQIWKTTTGGGEPVQVTVHGGRNPLVSLDNQFLFYLRLASRDGAQDLFRIPLKDGYEEKLLSFVDAFAVNRDGIAFKYYQPATEGPDLRFFRFQNGYTTRIGAGDRPLRYGIALSPDGRYLLYSQADYTVTDIKLADNL